MGANRRKRKQRNAGSPPFKTAKMNATSCDKDGDITISNLLLMDNKDLKAQYEDLKNSLEFHISQLEKNEINKQINKQMQDTQ